jgi:RimJ/RimL family protein N-acetyltransferase
LSGAPDRPPAELPAGPVTLVTFRGDEAPTLTRLVAQNRDHLRPWMPWASGEPGEEAQGGFVTGSMADWAARTAFGFWIREEPSGDMVGCAGLHRRDGPTSVEIGYWVSAHRARRGYATASARALTSAAFGLPGITRVEIHCDVANAPSAGVPRRLGYRLDRIEDVPLAAPGETGRQMVWTVDAGTWPEGVRASS